MAFVCKRCGQSSTTKGNLIMHLRSKKACTPENEDTSREELIAELKRRDYKTDTTTCQFCKKTLSASQIARHKKTCKKNRPVETIYNLQAQIDEQKKEQENMLAQIHVLRRELQIYKHSGTQFTQDTEMHEDNTELVEQPLNKNEPTPSKTKKAKISHAIRIVCWNTYIGEEIGKAQCVCCKTNNITQHNFHCGHVIAEAKGGKLHVSNLRPICAVCNNSMGTTNMKEYAFNHFDVEV
jgi:hypothetical protein